MNRLMNRRRFAATCLVMACLMTTLGGASAAIVYVDARDGVAGNTAVAPSAGGGVFNPSGAIGNQGPANDGLWDLRAFGNVATIYQNASTTAVVDNAQRLVTTATVVPGTYNVYAYFWSDSSNQWRMRASFTDQAGDIPLYIPGDAGVTQFYTGADATVLSSTLMPNPFVTPVMIAEGNRRLYQIALGQLSTATNLSVYIDDMGSTQTTFNERTWYDGIGYELVPEPTSCMLLALCAPFAGLVRRRRHGC
jgi:hypothetical protein